MKTLIRAKRALGVLIAVVGILLICASLYIDMNDPLKQYAWYVNLLLNLGSGAVGAALVLFVVEVNIQRLQLHVENEQELTHLISDLGSRVNSNAIRAAEILKRREWWKDSTLSKVNLSGASLHAANFVEVNLEGALLSGADLREADFTYANLKRADLGGSKCQKLDKNSPRAATFWHADLEGATFGSADLTGVNFGGANLKGVDFASAILLDATFDGAQFDETTSLPDDKKWSAASDMTVFTKRPPLSVKVVSNVR